MGRETLGRVLNVLGEPVDGLGPVKANQRYQIHRPAPSLEDQSTTLEMFETGIKVVDLMEPYLKGGKIGLFGGAVLWQDRSHSRAHPQRRHTQRTAASPSSPTRSSSSPSGAAIPSAASA